MQNEHTYYSGLLERLKALDLNAFGELYGHARERLFIYALAIVKDEAAAQDIVQELFADFWEGQLFQQVHTGLIAYLIRAVRNRSLSFLKREQTRLELRKNHFHTGEQTALPVLDAMETEELGAAIESAIENLPPMPAKVFRLHYQEKLSYQEIADLLSISPHTVSNHMTRALKQLRESLKNN